MTITKIFRGTILNSNFPQLFSYKIVYIRSLIILFLVERDKKYEKKSYCGFWIHLFMENLTGTALVKRQKFEPLCCCATFSSRLLVEGEPDLRPVPFLRFARVSEGEGRKDSAPSREINLIFNQIWRAPEPQGTTKGARPYALAQSRSLAGPRPFKRDEPSRQRVSPFRD